MEYEQLCRVVFEKQTPESHILRVHVLHTTCSIWIGPILDSYIVGKIGQMHIDHAVCK